MSTSEMIDDSPADLGHLINLEGAVDDLHSQHKATHAVLQDILSRLGPVQAQNAPNPLVRHIGKLHCKVLTYHRIDTL